MLETPFADLLHSSLATISSNQNPVLLNVFLSASFVSSAVAFFFKRNATTEDAEDAEGLRS